ncbi:hypothetical protein EDC96DRAFT_501788 [Choanephora cucurbitarum]|nr:hypothetical protein EDC96DRAFT_501788 [Choanephora cucurbitarum]
MENSNLNVANHILASILHDLSFLKEHSFIEQKTYNDVIALLPNQIHPPTERPPLPTRKSINQSSTTRDLPKLPTRRADWQNNQPLVKAIPTEPEKTASPPAYAQAIQQQDSILTMAEALYDYHGEDPQTDLSFKQGDLIEVIEYVNDDWWKGTVHGKSGIFPQNHVKKIAPVVKPKKPWAPPLSAKPAFPSPPPPQQHYTTETQNTPYHYPPPPQAMYQPPPPPPAQNYGPPPAQNYGQSSTVVTHTEEEDHGGDKKVANMAKKFGGNVATAATWGFGATLGSQAASAIF